MTARLLRLILPAVLAIAATSSFTAPPAVAQPATVIDPGPGGVVVIDRRVAPRYRYNRAYRPYRAAPRYYRPGYRYYRPGYRYVRPYPRYRSGIYFGFGSVRGPIIGGPVIGAPLVVAPRVRRVPRGVYRAWSPEWIAYCSRKYKSFNPRTGYYLAYSGRYRFCR